MRMLQRALMAGIAVLLAGATLGGCAGPSADTDGDSSAGNESASVSDFMQENEILTYEPVSEDKTVITVGKFASFESDFLEEALEAQFPQVDFVFYESGVGLYSTSYMILEAREGLLPDVVISSGSGHDMEGEFYDLSTQPFTQNYNLTALNSLSVDGKIYNLPLTTSLSGLVCNKTLFEEHGWSVPQTVDEFYALCDTIQAAGIRPFAPCFKYNGTIDSVCLGLNLENSYLDVNNLLDYEAIGRGEGSIEEYADPLLTTMRKLYDEGIINDGDFSSSATQIRKSLYAGEVAMIPTAYDIFNFYNDEKPNCEIEFFGYPTSTPGENWFQMDNGYLVSASKSSMEDAAKSQTILDLLEFLSSTEGHDVLLSGLNGVSSLTDYEMAKTDRNAQLVEALDSGQIYMGIEVGSGDLIPYFEQFCQGSATEAEVTQAMKESKNPSFEERLDVPSFGSASEDFTILETSTYMADKLKESTGADVSLMLNNTYYGGNLARIFEGDIIMPERFYLKGIAGKDYITVYEMSGAAIKEALNHPFANGAEVDAIYAFSGLKMTVSPWAGMGNRVTDVTLADGTALDDDALYRVAAWAGTIDEDYLTSTVQSFDELGDNVTFMESAIAAEGTIAPAHDDRLTLNWDNRE